MAKISLNTAYASVIYRAAVVRLCGIQFVNVIFQNRKVLWAAVVMVTNVTARAL